MSWLQLYQLKRTFRWSLWLMPALAIGLVLVVAPLIRWVDRVTGWTWFNFAPEGARTILGAFTSSMLTFVVFVVSSLLIVVQLARRVDSAHHRHGFLGQTPQMGPQRLHLCLHVYHRRLGPN